MAGPPSTDRVPVPMGRLQLAAGVGAGTRGTPLLNLLVRLVAVAAELLSLRSVRPTPRKVRTDEERSSRRVRFDGPVTLVQGRMRTRASSSDLSEGGAFIRTPQPPGVGSRVQVTVRLDGQLILATPARVRWIQVDDRHRPTGCGVAFEDLSEDTRAAIQELLDSVEATREPATRRPAASRPRVRHFFARHAG